MNVSAPRLPWPRDFPDVVVHTTLRVRASHPDYLTAKAGDVDAARRLACALISHGAVAELRNAIAGREHIVLLPVTAEETAGFNAIPDAMAQHLADMLGLRAVAGAVVQANMVGHTKADGWHRLVTPAIFNGPVIQGTSYMLVDDHVGFGGTLANLRGHIAFAGGKVVGMTTLTQTPGAHKIAVRPVTLDMLWTTHGRGLDDFWRTEFGHGLDCLTELEAGYLCRVESLARIKARMAAAAELARRGGFSAGLLNQKNFLLLLSCA